MITYDIDGLTLVDSSGRRVGIRDEAYLQMLAVRDAQLGAKGDNDAAGFKYHDDLQKFQEAVNAGRAAGLTAPTKPSMKTVADDGVITVGPFAPPLPDPVYPVISPSGSIKSAPAGDRTDLILSVLIAMNGKLDKLMAK